MAKLDLLKLAKQVENDQYTDVDLSFGKVRLYQVPEPMIWRYNPKRPRPVRPTVSMRLATGGKQERPIKVGDEGYDQWLADEEAYEDELSALRVAARFVLALRDIEYPDLSQPPPLLAQVNGEIDYPATDLLRKKVWLDHTVLARAADYLKLQTAMMERDGNLLDDAVENAKKNSESTTTDDQ
jgi:hypothetical protein